MKLHYKLNNKIGVEVEADGQKELFKEIASVQEIFGESKCGMCGKEDIKFVVRNVDSNEYYEMRCLSCYAALPFGQHKKGGTLFPKRKDENNKYLPNNGWYIWNKETKEKE